MLMAKSYKCKCHSTAVAVMFVLSRSMFYCTLTLQGRSRSRNC